MSLPLLIFHLILELLTLFIRQSQEIKGVMVINTENKLFLYAHNIMLILQSYAMSLPKSTELCSRNCTACNPMSSFVWSVTAQKSTPLLGWLYRPLWSATAVLPCCFVWAGIWWPHRHTKLTLLVSSPFHASCHQESMQNNIEARHRTIARLPSWWYNILLYYMR